MGGSAPAAPAQSNQAELMLAREQQRQNDLLYKQQAERDEAKRIADEAEAENLREIGLRDAQAAAEKSERDRRASRGKRDLLYSSAVGVSDGTTNSAPMQKLGGV